MPIAVKDFSWEETESTVYLTVPLKGVKPSKADIFSTDEYIKVHYPPYLFECLLYAAVDEDSSKAHVSPACITFTLPKQTHELWGTLSSPDQVDKKKLKEKKEEAVKHAQRRAEEIEKDKQTQKREREKYAVNKAIELDTCERERIDGEKQAARDEATAQLEDWKRTQHQAEQAQAELQQERERLAEKVKEEEVKAVEEARRNKRRRKQGSIFEEAAEGAGGVRDTGRIPVTFTPRVFPTPVRESTKEREDEWLGKQTAARRVMELEDADLTPEERDPHYLKEKALGFYKAGDFQSAIGVYSLAIRLNPKLPSNYSNRGACHLQVNNLMKCIEDCSKALDLLQPAVDANAASRVKAHVRRGTAFCSMELYVEGLQDYEAALKVNPGNEKLKEDSEKIRTIIQSSTS